VVRITNVSKGIAPYVLAIIIIAIIMGIVILIFVADQTGFLENSGAKLTDLISIKLP
jgi:hypothetical protein